MRHALDLLHLAASHLSIGDLEAGTALRDARCDRTPSLRPRRRIGGLRVRHDRDVIAIVMVNTQ